MKYLVLILSILVFAITPALANDFDDLQWGEKKIAYDHPYAVQVMNTPIYFGWELAKSIDSSQTFRDGYSAVVKFTATNTFFGKSPWGLKSVE